METRISSYHPISPYKSSQGLGQQQQIANETRETCTAPKKGHLECGSFGNNRKSRLLFLKYRCGVQNMKNDYTHLKNIDAYVVM